MMRILIDFKGTICTDKGNSDICAMRTLQELGKKHELILWTLGSTEKALEFCHRNAIEITIDNSYDKPIFDYVIDDRAIGIPIYYDALGMSNVDWPKLRKILVKLNLI